MTILALRPVVCACALTASLPLASAGPMLTPISQQRTVEAEAAVRFGEDTASDIDSDGAPDFGPFNSSVAASAQLTSQPGTSAGSASQQSLINPNSLSGIGSASASAEPGFAFEMTASGGSFYNVTFSLADATEYSFTGQLDAGVAGSAGQPLAQATLSDVGGDVYAVNTTSGPTAILSSGILAPGTYTIDVIATAFIEASGESASASFDFNFTLVPEPASLLGLSFAWLCVGLRRRR